MDVHLDVPLNIRSYLLCLTLGHTGQGWPLARLDWEEFETRDPVYALLFSPGIGYYADDKQSGTESAGRRQSPITTTHSRITGRGRIKDTKKAGDTMSEAHRPPTPLDPGRTRGSYQNKTYSSISND